MNSRKYRNRLIVQQLDNSLNISEIVLKWRDQLKGYSFIKNSFNLLKKGGYIKYIDLYNSSCKFGILIKLNKNESDIVNSITLKNNYYVWKIYLNNYYIFYKKHIKKKGIVKKWTESIVNLQS